jgi:putative lipoprotein
MRLVPVFALAAMLVACQSVPAPEHGVGAPSATTPRAIVVHGRAFHLERMLVPAGAVLDVQLIDDRIADGPDAMRPATVARMSYGDLRSSPYVFDLPLDADRMDADGRYSVRATLRDAHGRLMFATPSRVPVAPGAASPLELHLVRVTLPPP